MLLGGATDLFVAVPVFLPASSLNLRFDFSQDTTPYPGPLRCNGSLSDLRFE